MNITRGKREHAEAERADALGGGTLGRRSVLGGVLGGLAALPVLYGVGSATPALAASAVRARSVPTPAGELVPTPASDLIRETERRYNTPLLTPGTRLVLPPGVKAVPVLDYYHRPRVASAGYAWPYMRATDGTTVDASVIPERGAPTRIAILSGPRAGTSSSMQTGGRTA